MKEFEIWFSCNSLIINSDKTKAMLFNFNKICNLVKRKMVFKNFEISYTSEGKFLGINISNNLKWNTYIQLLCWKLIKISYIIKSLRGDWSLFKLRNTYFAKFQSLTRYGIIFVGWGNWEYKGTKNTKKGTLFNKRA